MNGKAPTNDYRLGTGDKVRVTGEMSVVPGSTCFMEIDKIEKAQ